MPAGGGLLVAHYNDSVQQALSEVYPNHEWLPWLFPAVPRDFWTKPANIKKFFAWAATQLKISEPSDWYKITHADMAKLGGGGLLGIHFGNSLVSALKVAYPQHEWIEWKATSVPRNYWLQRENQQKFLYWVLEQQERPNDLSAFYEISNAAIQEYGGRRLLQIYGDRKYPMLTGVFPDHHWQRWKFEVVPQEHWHALKSTTHLETTKQELQEYLQASATKLRLENLSGWYRVSRVQINDIGGMSSAIRVFEGLPKLLQQAYPNHNWEPKMFGRKP